MWYQVSSTLRSLPEPENDCGVARDDRQEGEGELREGREDPVCSPGINLSSILTKYLWDLDSTL